MKNAVIGLLVIILVAAAYYYFRIYPEQSQEAPAPPPIMVQKPEPVVVPPPEPIKPPVQDAAIEVLEPEPAPEPLPPLAESDSLVRESLAGLMGEATVIQSLVTEEMVSRFVASVDALTSRQVPDQIRVVLGPGGEFEATANDQPDELIRNAEGDPIPQFIVDPVNHQRYTKQVEMFEAVDSGELLDLYREMSPLLGQAWAELGYPDGGFDSRLVEVIDSLLATPEVQTPIQLVKPEAFYLFVDPELESLPAGQKLMLRMGNENAARVKAKLREIRSLLLAQN